jgi:hypothetical protein
MILIVNVIIINANIDIPIKVRIKNNIGDITHIQLILRIPTKFRKASANVKYIETLNIVMFV